MNAKLLVVFAMTAGGAFPAGATQSPSKENFAFATIDRGIHVGFVLLRTGSAEASGDMGETFVPRARGVNRILFDRQSAAFFGYRIEVEPAGKGRFEVTFAALPKGAEKDLPRDVFCPTCPAPTKLMAAIQRFPAPRTVDNGALLTLDLLQNPATGEKIVDVVQVASWPLTSESMKAAASKALEVMRLVVRADTDLARGNGDLAIASYLKALSLQPEDATLHNKLGISYQRTGRADKAREQYEEAVRLNPDYASAWNNLGTVHHTQGRHAKAVSYYRKAIEKRSDFAAAWRNLGAVELARGNVQQGLSAYREALRLDPSALDTANSSGVAVAGLPVALQYFYFAKLTAANGQVVTAIEFLEKACEGGFREFDRVRRDPDFAAVLKEPRYKALEAASR